MWGNLFSSIRNRISRYGGDMTRRQQGELDRGISTIQQTYGSRNATNAITSYFYASTLGLNPWSVIQNLFQPMLTTGPAIGLGPTLAGFKDMKGRIGKYVGEVGSEYRRLQAVSHNPIRNFNEATEQAFSRVFGELARGGLRIDPRLFELDPNTGGMLASGKFRSAEDLFRVMLQPFTHAELSNQATTYFGAKHAIRDAVRLGGMRPPPDVTTGKPLVGDAFEDWLGLEASQIVNATQFRPGPGSRTIWQGTVPGYFRQFTTFPIRAFSFMTESTIRGAMTAKQIEGEGLLARMTGGRNLGTLSRLILYSRIINNGLKEVAGVDISNALGLTAPFAIAPQGQLFAPYPLPPVASVTTGLISSALNRDLKRMQPMNLPMIGEVPIPRTLFPGGIMLSRIGRALNQWRPDTGGFVDDYERLLYKGSETDLLLTMMGVPLVKHRRLQDKVERIRSMRMRMRDFRRKYAVASVQANYGEMRSLQDRWRKTFPDFPELTVSMKDIRRYRMNMQIPLLQRMLNTMGETGEYIQKGVWDYDQSLVEDPAFLAPGMLSQ